VVDEHRLAELALTATASQLARMIAGFRAADGMRIGQQAKQNLSWHEREDGMIDVRARLPEDEAALLLAAIEAAKDQFGPPPAKPDPCGEESAGTPDAASYSNADALVDVARVFLNTAPEDRSGEDRTLVVVQVSAQNLARNNPAGTPEARPAMLDPVGNLPAGTSSPESAVCHLDGVGSIEPATAQRLACDNPMLGGDRYAWQGLGAGPYPVVW
jgi:hypothetical protein